MDETSWPHAEHQPQGEHDPASMLYQAQLDDVLDAAKQARAAEASAQAADDAADAADLARFTSQTYDLANGSIARSRAAAELVQKASAAIATLYSGVVAVVFSVSDNPLPPRGVLAPLFLGGAVLLSTAYVSYVGPELRSVQVELAQGPEPKAFARLRAFTKLTSQMVAARSSALRASVVSLGFGLAFIVAPFVSFASTTTSQVASSPQWPQPPSSGTTQLDVLLYQAQVKEVAELRANPPLRTGTQPQDLYWLGFGIAIGGASVVLVATDRIGGFKDE